jgi:HPt (histidine-containing phosphotransfer) domain-containing protein
MTKRYERQVDPERVLDPAERAKRVENARKAHMLAMALKSAKARRLRKEAALIEAELAAEDVPVNGGQA